MNGLIEQLVFDFDYDLLARKLSLGESKVTEDSFQPAFSLKTFFGLLWKAGLLSNWLRSKFSSLQKAALLWHQTPSYDS